MLLAQVEDAKPLGKRQDLLLRSVREPGERPDDAGVATHGERARLAARLAPGPDEAARVGRAVQDDLRR
jgi:hypothetical protein